MREVCCLRSSSKLFHILVPLKLKERWPVFVLKSGICKESLVNTCGHIIVRDLTMAYSVNSKRRTLIRGKSIHESFRESILRSIIAECKRKHSVEVFGANTKMVDSETPNCEQQAVPAKSARRKECDHVRSAFRFDKQSHVTNIVNVRRNNQLSLHNQLSLLSLNLRSTCFGSMCDTEGYGVLVVLVYSLSQLRVLIGLGFL